MLPLADRSSAHGRPPVPSPTHPPAAGRYRWVVCALLFAATTINYVDRQVIGILKPTLQAELGWSEIDYGNIVFAFQLAYAIGLLLAGRVIDRLGTKWGYAMALLFWSLAAAGHAAARSVAGFTGARFALGLGEAGNFPAAIKSVAEWFPKRERALATGILNSGSNVGAMLAPIVVPALALTYGWQAAFLITGLLGLLWLVLWVPLYESPDRVRRLSAAELAYIRSDPPDPATPIPWRVLVGCRQAWAFATAKFLTDPIWYLYLFWIPDFLSRNLHLDLKSIGLPLVTIYLMADLGSIGGGWLSSSLLKRGWSVNRARKVAMLLCALCTVPIVFAARVESAWGAVALVSLAAAAHQGWSVNLFTTTSDCFPRRTVASIVGFGSMAGAVGGMFIAQLTGYLLHVTGSYVFVFGMAGAAYLTALVIFHLIAPRLEPVDPTRPGSRG